MYQQRKQFRNNSSGQGTFRGTQHQQNWPRKYHKDYSAAVSSVPSATPDFDFKRMEAFMETMTKSMETLTCRLSSLEKGQPSHAVEQMGNPAPPRGRTSPYVCLYCTFCTRLAPCTQQTILFSSYSSLWTFCASNAICKS